MEEASEWLLDYLRRGAHSSEDVIKDGAAAGFSRDTLFRAKKGVENLVKARKGSYGGAWSWYLTEEALQESEEASDRRAGSDSSDSSDSSIISSEKRQASEESEESETIPFKTPFDDD